MGNNLVQILFSPAGSTAKVADAICSQMRTKYETIDLSREISSREFDDSTVLLAAVPVFGGRIPQTAKERILRLKAKGNPAIAVVVYGNRAYDDALLELKDTLTEIGCTVIAAGAFIGEHSMAKEVAAGRPDLKDIEKAKQFAAQVLSKMESGQRESVNVPGNPDYKTKKAGNGMAPKAGKGCSSCGLCAKLCPVQAIPKENPKQTLKSCIGCMRCVSVCPMHARALEKPVKLMVGLALSSAKKEAKQPELFF